MKHPKQLPLPHPLHNLVKSKLRVKRGGGGKPFKLSFVRFLHGAEGAANASAISKAPNSVMLLSRDLLEIKHNPDVFMHDEPAILRSVKRDKLLMSASFMSTVQPSS